ncbi:MAG: ROK family protein [Streptosporangiaceae bacterium]
MDFGGTKVALATADLAGRRLAARRLPARAADGADAVVERALAAARDLIAQTTSRTGSPLVATAATSPGIVLPGRILLAPNNPGWDHLALEAAIRRGLRTDKAAAGNDVKAAALAEARWGTLAGRGPGMFLNIGTGLAAAFIVDGQVISGAHGTAGELGYSLLGPADGQAFASGHAPLEECVSGRALARQVSEVLGEQLTTAEVFARAGCDRRLQHLLTSALDTLGAHIANLALALDPAVIVVSDGMAGAALILPRLRATLERAVPFPPAVRPARFTRDASLAGAVALALDAARTSPPRDAEAGGTCRPGVSVRGEEGAMTRPAHGLAAPAAGGIAAEMAE